MNDLSTHCLGENYEAMLDLLTREMFTNVGIAVHSAAAIEWSLAQLLARFDLLPKLKPFPHPNENYHVFMSKTYQLTMGKLINCLKKVITVPNELEDLLKQVCEKRNFLIHHHYRENLINLMSIKNCKKMIIELQSIIELFTKTDDMLMKIIDDSNKQYMKIKKIKNMAEKMNNKTWLSIRKAQINDKIIGI